MDDVLQRALELQAKEEPFALATVVAVQRPASARPGMRAIVRADGTLEGWVGGACAHPVVAREGLAVMHDGAPRLLHLSPSRDAAAAREGVFHYPMTCHSGGSLEIYVEPVLPKPQLLLVGDTPLVSGLARLGQLTGFAVWVADGGDHLRPPAADLYLPLADLRGRISAETYAVVATLGSDDEAALEQVVGAGPRYVGLVASRKRAEAVFAYLRERGVPADQLQRIKAPAGLDLGAVTPEEIALSIMAEIVQVRRRRAAAPGETVVRGEAAEAIDPVCGMTVAVATARHSALHQGVMFYFCSARCRQEFEHDPARFVPAVR